MSDIKYGLISKVDSECIEATINYIISDFPNEVINVTEIGLYNCESSMGIVQYIQSKKRECFFTGIDNEKDKPILFPNSITSNKLIIGNSNEVYNQLEDNSQHFIFVDGCHCFSHVVSDFFCYADKVKAGGYLAFHDTGSHIKPFKDFQHGDKDNPDAYISVRKALIKIGLLDDKLEGWEIALNEADHNNEAGGICVFKKLY